MYFELTDPIVVPTEWSFREILTYASSLITQTNCFALAKASGSGHAELRGGGEELSCT